MIYLRLSKSLVPLGEKMALSYEKLGAFLTELKMEHKDGKLASEKLNQLLGSHYCDICFKQCIYIQPCSFVNNSFDECDSGPCSHLHAQSDYIVGFCKPWLYGHMKNCMDLLKPFAVGFVRLAFFLYMMDPPHDDGESAEDWILELLKYNREAPHFHEANETASIFFVEHWELDYI